MTPPLRGSEATLSLNWDLKSEGTRFLNSSPGPSDIVAEIVVAVFVKLSGPRARQSRPACGLERPLVCVQPAPDLQLSRPQVSALGSHCTHTPPSCWKNKQLTSNREDAQFFGEVRGSGKVVCYNVICHRRKNLQQQKRLTGN